MFPLSRALRWLLLLLISALLFPPSSSAAPPRGALLAGPTLVPIALPGGASIDSMEPGTLRTVLQRAQGGVLMPIAGEPHCGISVYSLRYQTVGGRAEAAEASGVVMLPGGEDAHCTGPRPVLLYAHGTSLDRNFSMSRLNGEARLVAAMFVAQGYIVVAPDYAGYGSSTLPYHPYLNGQQQGADMVDALRAARVAWARLGRQASARLFLTGYSQGGYVALATQRAMEQDYGDEFKVTAAAGLSGPYALLQMSDDIFAGKPNAGITAYLPLLTTAGQRSGAVLYTSPAELYEARYANGIETLLPGTQRVDDLIKSGKLPAGALFARDSQPQGAGAASYFADLNLVRTSYRDAYLQDVAEHPCGADAGQPLDCHAGNALRAWMRKNDLRNFTPQHPLLLCGGGRDPVVPFANASAAAAYFRVHGAVPQLLDLESPQAPYAAIQHDFAQAQLRIQNEAKDKGRDPAKAVMDNYHGRLVAQYCFMAAREFFQQMSR
jgi:alpha-beta hydrolase superfamily lysophospholipase